MRIDIINDIIINNRGSVFNQNTGECFTINETGIKVIEMAKEGKTTEEIAVELSNIYGIDKCDAEADLADFAMLLNQYELLKK